MKTVLFIALILAGCVVSSKNEAAEGLCKRAFARTPTESIAIKIDRLENLVESEVKVTSKDANAVGAKGISLLLCSMGNKNRQAFQFLLSNGADPNLQIRGGYSIVHYASANADSYYLEKTLEFGGDPGQENRKQMWKPSPIYFAVDEDIEANVEILLSHGANIDQVNTMNETPLVFAANSNNFKMSYFLMKKGSNLTLKNTQGFTMLEIVKLSKLTEGSPMKGWKEKLLQEAK